MFIPFTSPLHSPRLLFCPFPQLLSLPRPLNLWFPLLLTLIPPHHQRHLNPMQVVNDRAMQ